MPAQATHPTLLLNAAVQINETPGDAEVFVIVDI